MDQVKLNWSCVCCSLNNWIIYYIDDELMVLQEYGAIYVTSFAIKVYSVLLLLLVRVVDFYILTITMFFYQYLISEKSL
jgi:hypothetical protein